jgi:hypothetical protein
MASNRARMIIIIIIIIIIIRKSVAQIGSDCIASNGRIINELERKLKVPLVI